MILTIIRIISMDFRVSMQVFSSLVKVYHIITFGSIVIVSMCRKTVTNLTVS